MNRGVFCHVKHLICENHYVPYIVHPPRTEPVQTTKKGITAIFFCQLEQKFSQILKNEIKNKKKQRR